MEGKLSEIFNLIQFVTERVTPLHFTLVRRRRTFTNSRLITSTVCPSPSHRVMVSSADRRFAAVDRRGGSHVALLSEGEVGTSETAAFL